MTARDSQERGSDPFEYIRSPNLLHAPACSDLSEVVVGVGCLRHLAAAVVYEQIVQVDFHVEGVRISVEKKD